MILLTGLSPSMDKLSNSFSYHMTFLLIRSYNPDSNTQCKSLTTQFAKYLFLLHSVLESVWAFPLSLVATEGISVDFYSSGY